MKIKALARLLASCRDATENLLLSMANDRAFTRNAMRGNAQQFALHVVKLGLIKFVPSLQQYQNGWLRECAAWADDAHSYATICKGGKIRANDWDETFFGWFAEPGVVKFISRNRDLLLPSQQSASVRQELATDVWGRMEILQRRLQEWFLANKDFERDDFYSIMKNALELGEN